MPSQNMSKILAQLHGSDVRLQVEALERFFALPPASVSDEDKSAVLDAGVNAMEVSSNPFLIAQRLARFGEAAISPLSSLLARNPSSEVTIVTALLLVNNGSRLGVPVLVAEVERGGGFIATASLAMANAGFTDHVPAVIERLRRWSVPIDRKFPTTDDEVVLCLLEAIDTLRVPLPDDIRRKFADPQAPEFYRLAVQRSRVGVSRPE